MITRSFDGVQISYEENGSNELSLVFVHGWCCDRSFWNAQMDYFSNKYHVVAIDLPGFFNGSKNRDQWTMQAYGKDVATVVKELNLDKIILIGHSMGGAIILNAASELPDNVIGLVGVDTDFAMNNHFSAEELEPALKPLAAHDTEHIKKNNIRPMFRPDADPSFVDELSTKMLSANSEVVYRTAFHYLMFNGKKIFEEINLPIWFILGGKPETFKDTPLANYAKLVLIEDVGHFLMIEKPDEFNQKLDLIIKEITDSDAK